MLKNVYSEFGNEGLVEGVDKKQIKAKIKNIKKRLSKQTS
jgi:hypothetical protein